MGCGLLWNAWVSYCASLMCQFSAGNMYLFSTYSAELKDVLFAGDVNGQSKLQTIALVGNIFAFMPVAGIWYDSKWGGVTTTLIIGVMLSFSGYFFLHLVLSRQWNCGIVLACVFAGLWGHGSGYYDTSALTCGVKNLPHHRALIVGMQKAFLGLAGAIITRAGVAFFPSSEDKDKYLLFVAFISSVPALLSIPFLCETVPLPADDAYAMKKLHIAFGILGFLAISILVASLIQAFSSEEEDDHTLEYVVFGVGVGCIFILGGVLLFKSGPWRVYVQEDRTKPMEKSMGTMKAVSETDDDEDPVKKNPLTETTKLVEAEGEDGIPPGEALKTVDFWLLFVVLGVGTGGGLTVLNNASQMVTAKGKDSTEIDISVSLLYVFNSMGRIILALFSDKMNSMGISRLIIFSCTVLLHGCAHAILLGNGDMAYPGFCLAGLSYGGLQAVFPAAVSDLFGIKYFASNYMWMMFSPSIGSLGFSTLLASGIYEMHQNPPDENGDIECIGDDCFFVTHLVVALSCAAAFLIGLYLNMRQSKAKLARAAENRKSARLSAANIAAFETD